MNKETSTGLSITLGLVSAGGIIGAVCAPHISLTVGIGVSVASMLGFFGAATGIVYSCSQSDGAIKEKEKNEEKNEEQKIELTPVQVIDSESPKVNQKLDKENDFENPKIEKLQREINTLSLQQQKDKQFSDDQISLLKREIDSQNEKIRSLGHRNFSPANDEPDASGEAKSSPVPTTPETPAQTENTTSNVSSLLISQGMYKGALRLRKPSESSSTPSLKTKKSADELRI